ncbi:MAG: rRNA maturation RNase YbeY [Elusimicrobia bacterium CG_4_10_14_3_um_filter_49_12_50_7]|nr:MAG: rRNA maturation RNase YbeY [Elusimicrobia bacterium CG03_land_8_20_14_0_80_50_18]PIX13923.1 MAG: rRNA maturation RNase YbeY [Elusimicrobia bacterium CG_4_8_14_3_um_filter_50_9]PIY17866.1 MAG: rRNA maturation RNase YbeY [Elusimicrobia bacterium CG_4_10_14_3_um_filter_49_12_50_7]
MPRVEFFSEAPARGLSIIKLKDFAARALKELGFKRPVNIVLTGSEGIKRLNRRFFSKKSMTDVIVFDLGGRGCARGEEFCEIYICLDAARKASSDLGHSTGQELRILIAHGLLHLTGMDDSSPEGKKKMLEAGDALVSKLSR